MKTTAFYIELIVIGTLAATALLLILSFDDELWQYLRSVAGEGVIYVTPIVVVFVYLLGIITDRLADHHFSRIHTYGRPYRRKIFQHTADSKSKTRKKLYAIFASSSEMTESVVSYFRRRLRVLRAAYYLVPAISVLIVLKLLFLGHGWMVLVVSALLFFLSFASGWAAIRMVGKYGGLVDGIHQSKFDA